MADDYSAAFLDYSHKFVIHDDTAITQKVWEHKHKDVEFLSLLPREIQQLLKKEYPKTPSTTNSQI